jgi:hypothetical protein
MNQFWTAMPDNQDKSDKNLNQDAQQQNQEDVAADKKDDSIKEKVGDQPRPRTTEQ